MLAQEVALVEAEDAVDGRVDVGELAARVAAVDDVGGVLDEVAILLAAGPQLLLGLAPRGDVFDGALEVKRAAVRADHDARVLVDEQRRTVAPPPRPFEIAHFAEPMEERLERAAVGVGVHAVALEVPSAQLVDGFESEHLHQRRIGHHDLAVRRGAVDTDGGVLEQIAVGALGARALGDVAERGDGVDDVAVDVAQRCGGELDHQRTDFHALAQHGLARQRADHRRQREVGAVAQDLPRGAVRPWGFAVGANDAERHALEQFEKPLLARGERANEVDRMGHADSR